jgi:hypothetical protein
VPDRAALGIPIASLIAHAGGELVFTSTNISSFVDASIWPPRVVVHPGQYALHAARSASGRWLVHTSPDPGIKRTWSLRWFDRITAGEHASEEPEPVPLRDFTPFAAELEPSRRQGELVHIERIESLHVCGELPVVVPRYVGLGERRHPYVQRDGRWIEETSLPPFEKPLAELTSRCPTACVRLRDGTDVLVWNGHVFASRPHGFEKLYDLQLELRWYNRWELVAAAGGGLYSMHGDGLVELGPTGTRVHLPGVTVSGLHRGPGETLLVSSSEGELLYDPIAGAVAELDDVIGRRAAIAGVTAAGDLLLLDQREYDLRLIRAVELVGLPRRRADEPPVIEPPAPVGLFDELGATSRPQIAAAGEQLVLGVGSTVRFHTVDAPSGVFRHGCEVVAVARAKRQAAALDVSGVLHVFEDGELVASRPVTQAPRSLAVTPDGRWLVVSEHGVSIVDAGAKSERIEFPGAIAIAADPDGAIVILGDDRRLALWEHGELVDIPESAEQLVAIAALGGRRFVCAGQRNLFVLDLAQRELDALYQQNTAPHLAVSPNGARIAWASGTSVSVANLAGEALEHLDGVHYPETFSDPDDEPLQVRGLAFLDDDRLAVALSHGRGNILDVTQGRALKLDPQPGDPTSRWVFTFGGQILIAG